MAEGSLGLFPGAFGSVLCPAACCCGRFRLVVRPFRRPQWQTQGANFGADGAGRVIPHLERRCRSAVPTGHGLALPHGGGYLCLASSLLGFAYDNSRRVGGSSIHRFYQYDGRHERVPWTVHRRLSPLRRLLQSNGDRCPIHRLGSSGHDHSRCEGPERPRYRKGAVLSPIVDR